MKKLVLAAAIVAALTAPAPAMAWGLGPHPDGWYKETVDGWTYWMPPAVCTRGPLPAIYDGGPNYRTLAYMESHWGRGSLGNIWIDTYGMHIDVARDAKVSARVAARNLIHEEAEARGCGDDPYDRQFTIQ